MSDETQDPNSMTVAEAYRLKHQLGQSITWGNSGLNALQVEELTKLTRALGLMYTRTTDPNGAVQVDHSGSAVIVDPQGKLAGMFRPPFTAAQITADLATLSR